MFFVCSREILSYSAGGVLEYSPLTQDTLKRFGAAIIAVRLLGAFRQLTLEKNIKIKEPDILACDLRFQGSCRFFPLSPDVINSDNERATK